MNNLKGQVAVITGGSRGLGKAMAFALAAEGVNIVITGRTESRLKEVVQELETTHGVKAAYASFDIGNYKAVQAGVKEIMTAFPKIDILINNAGIATFGSVMDMDVEEWERIIQTNLLGSYYVTKEILPQMIANQSGDILNVSSMAGLGGNATISAYAASKFGLIGFSDSLMKEVRKHNIRVCALTPSTVASDMSKELGLTDGNPDNVLQPEDFASLVIAGLKLPRRAMMTRSAVWSTNP
jgi:3-oxoacyl-[acyl-carrier protein] reductase